MATSPNSSLQKGLPRRVVLLATPTAQSLELAGPVEVFSMASMKLREAGRTRSSGYEVEVVSATEELTIRSSSKLRLLADRSFLEDTKPIDTLIVAGGMEVWSGKDRPLLLDWVRQRAGTVRRLAAVCTGSFVLAEAGLLDGVRATTHWYFCQQLQSEYPSIIVDPNPFIFRPDVFLHRPA